MKKRYIISIFATILILYLTNKIWLVPKGVRHVHFEFLQFVIISFCGFLFSLKITQYLSIFKNIENKSRIQIVFLTVFFIMLMIPMSNINSDENSQKENRRLAKWKPLVNASGAINYNFGNDYEHWFNDRFALRKNLINFNSIIRYNIAKYYRNKSAYIGKDGWMFLIWKEEVLLLNQENIIKISNYIKKIQKICSDRDVKVYILVAPNANILYTEKELFVAQKADPAPKLIEYIKEHNNLDIIYSYDAMNKRKNENIFFKTDVHWTDYGALISHNYFIEQMKKDCPNIKYLTDKDFKIKYGNDVDPFKGEKNMKRGGIYNNLNIRSNKPLKEIYKNYYFKDEDKGLLVEENPKTLTEIYYNPRGYDEKILVFGSSFVEKSKLYFAKDFKHFIKMRLNPPKVKQEDFFEINKMEKAIDEYKPDIFCLLFDVSWITFIVKYEDKLKKIKKAR